MEGGRVCLTKLGFHSIGSSSCRLAASFQTSSNGIEKSTSINGVAYAVRRRCRVGCTRRQALAHHVEFSMFVWVTEKRR